MGNKWAEIAKTISGRTENQVKNRFNAMIKKIREEKTFGQQKKTDISHALTSLDQTNLKDEYEGAWVEELI